jgi:hypothetical protein
MFRAAKQKNCHKILTFLFADSGEFVKVLHCLFWGEGEVDEWELIMRGTF